MGIATAEAHQSIACALSVGQQREAQVLRLEKTRKNVDAFEMLSMARHARAMERRIVTRRLDVT